MGRAWSGGRGRRGSSRVKRGDRVEGKKMAEAEENGTEVVEGLLWKAGARKRSRVECGKDVMEGRHGGREGNRKVWAMAEAGTNEAEAVEERMIKVEVEVREMERTGK